MFTRIRKVSIKYIIILLVIISIITLLVLVLIFSGKYFNFSKESHTISSLRNYNKSQCDNIGYGNKVNGFNSGVKLILIDKVTHMHIQGYVKISTKEYENTGKTETFICNEGIDSQNAIISAYITGYTPVVLDFQLPMNRLSTIEVLIIKSCTGGSSYFDNLKLLNKIYGKNDTTKYVEENQNIVFNQIKEKFGFEKNDYELQCIEGDSGRGGYFKAKGKYKDGSSFEMYYKSGWCSSGGADCGWSKCFTSQSSDLIETIKNKTCSILSSRHYGGDNACPLISKMLDNSSLAQSNCVAGQFENNNGKTKSFSVVQNSGRCDNSVTIGNFNCLEN